MSESIHNDSPRPESFHCSNCGAGLDMEIDSPVITCQYCGSKVLVPLEYRRKPPAQESQLHAFVLDLAKKASISAEGFYATGQSEYPYEDSAHVPMREWYKRHVQWFGKPPDQSTTAGYTGLHYFALAAQRVGKDLTREKFIDTLETFDRVAEPTFTGPPITFSAFPTT